MIKIYIGCRCEHVHLLCNETNDMNIYKYNLLWVKLECFGKHISFDTLN
jgi:hypothetical protein